MNIFVAKLSSVTKAEDLTELFSKIWRSNLRKSYYGP